MLEIHPKLQVLRKRKEDYKLGVTARVSNQNNHSDVLIVDTLSGIIVDQLPHRHWEADSMVSPKESIAPTGGSSCQWLLSWISCTCPLSSAWSILARPASGDLPLCRLRSEPL